MIYEPIDGGWIQARVTLDVQQDTEANRSTVKIRQLDIRTTSGAQMGPVWIVGGIDINGNRAASMDLSNTYQCGLANLNGSYDGGGDRDADKWWSGYSNNPVAVAHEADGTAEIAVRLAFSVVQSNTGNGIGAVNATVQIQLPTIARESKITVKTGTIEEPVIITIQRDADSLRNQLTWRCGQQGGNITAEPTEETVVQWKAPAEIGREYPREINIPITIVCETFSGNESIGRTEAKASVSIPDTAVPEVSAAVEDGTVYSSRHGGYIQNKSTARLLNTAQGKYGAYIDKIEASCCGAVGTGAGVQFALPESGSVAIRVTATDSRGRSGSWTTSINVIAYSEPRILITDAYRCDGFGERDDEAGRYLKVSFTASVSPVRNQIAEYHAVRKDRVSGTETVKPLDDLNGQLETAETVMMVAGIDNGYDVVIRVRDAFGTVDSVSALVQTAFALLDFYRDKKSVAVGMRAKKANTFSVGLTMDLHGNRIEGLDDPEQASDAATKEYVDNQITALRRELGLE